MCRLVATERAEIQKGEPFVVLQLSMPNCQTLICEGGAPVETNSDTGLCETESPNYRMNKMPSSTFDSEREVAKGAGKTRSSSF